MNWNRFLKPDWRKSKIFLVVIFLFSSLNGLGFHILLESPEKISDPYISGLYLISNPFNVIHTFLDFTPRDIFNEIELLINDVLIYPLITTLGLVYSYILSCLIIFTYDKFRGRKK